ncbi:MAG: general secretion pathway protein GspB [Betaproteobacteria bacterium]|nr:general secretion pathway protein GspB [Betaproteobacteria bacterium]
MSLILEALRKSEQERRQNVAGAAPGEVLTGATVVQVGTSRGVLWGAAAVVIAALSFAAWLWWSRPAVPPAAPAAQGTVLPAAAVAASPALTPAPTPAPITAAPPAPVSVAVAPAAESVSTPQVAPLAVGGAAPQLASSARALSAPPSPAPVARPAPASQLPPLPTSPSAQRAAAPAAQAEPAAAPRAGPGARAAPNAQVVFLADLPPEVRKELPPLTLSGYIHADQPGDRLLAINDKLVRIGDEVVPGLQVVSLAPGYVVLAYKGWRFRVATP